MKIEQRIYQYHFKAWPEDVYCSAPNDPGTVLGLLQDVALHQRELATDGIEQGPLIVHCGAGIGRTAVFIVIDILLQLITYQGGCEHVCTLKSATETVHCFGVCLNIWHCEDKPEHVTKCVHI